MENSVKVRKHHSKSWYAACTVLVILAVIELAPIILVFLNSFKSHFEILENPFALPKRWSFDNFIYTWKAGKFSEGFMNSFKVTGTAVITGTLAAASMGYVLAARKVKTWKILTLYFMIATTIPLQMFMLPLYKMFVDLDIMGNQYAVGFAIAAWDLPLPIFLMRTYFLKVPSELEEAARLDGASTWQVFRKVMLPIVSPGLLTVAIIIGLFSWNEYLLTSTLLQGDANFTVTLKYINLNGMFSKDFAVIMSGAVILMVPVITVFLLLQNKFIEGMAAGSVKG